MKTEEKHRSDKPSQTTQQCLKQNSPSESKSPLAEIPPIAEVKTERVVEVAQNPERPIKKEPEEEEKNAKDGSSLGIKIVECWSLRGIKEEPADAPLVSQPPPQAAASCKSEGGVANMPKVKQEAVAEEWQSESRKRPGSPSKQGPDTETGVVHKKFRPSHQPQLQSLGDGHKEGAWPVKVEKDPTSHDFPAEGEGEREIIGPPRSAVQGHEGGLRSPQPVDVLHKLNI